MPLPIAIQLYTIRDTLAKDFAAGVRKIAEMGYVGVETAGFPGTTAKEASKLFGELGLTVTSAHAPLPLGEQKNEVLDAIGELGCKRLVCPWVSPDHYQTLDLLKGTCERFNEANAVAVAHGLEFGLHNHWWEFEQVEGQYAHDILLAELDPAIFFQIDTYWVKVAGLDPAQIVTQFADRAPLLHIKDGPATKKDPMTAVGAGILEWAEIMSAAEGHAEWLIVELDRCATDMMSAVEESYTYLTGAGFARGNRP
ncbi:MAG: sugar phosphate isomerase/epimerase family protein [Ardenticatenaceae bacterium]